MKVKVNDREDKIKKIFSLLVILYPILNRYASFLPMMTLSETLLLIFLIFIILKKKIHIQKIFITFVFYLSLLVIYYLLYGDRGETLQDNVGTILRVIFLYGALSLVGRGYLDGERSIKWLNTAAILMVSYCILQWLGSKIGLNLTTYIPGLPIFSEDNVDAFLLKQQNDGTYRPRGLLNEPAHLSSYLFLPLAIDLFSKRKITSRIKKSAYITLGCFISMSSTGIIMCIIAWFVYIFFNNSKETKKYKKYAIILILVSVLIIPNTEIWGKFMIRTFGGDINNFNLSNTSRFGALNMLQLIFTDNLNFIIGFGMARTPFYLSGFFRVLFCLGILGIFIVFIQFVELYKNGNSLQKKLTLFYTGLNIGTEILLGNFAIYYLPFILADKREIS